MQQNEQLSENTTKEQVENGENNSNPNVEQTAAEDSNDEVAVKENPAITDSQATIKIEG